MQFKFLLFFTFLFATHLPSFTVSSRPSPAMTRIQEVFRSLIPPNEVRGKKYYDETYWNREPSTW